MEKKVHAMVSVLKPVQKSVLRKKKNTMSFQLFGISETDTLDKINAVFIDWYITFEVLRYRGTFCFEERSVY